MLRKSQLWIAILLVTAVSAASVSRPMHPSISKPHPQSASTGRELLDKYCLGCHNQKSATAGLALDTLNVDKIEDRAAVWEKIISKLRTGAMPPAGRPRPDTKDYRFLIGHLESELDRAAAENPNPGRPLIRRLNRAEYTNAVRDLLAVDIDGASLLPIDEVNHGFDNIADALSVTPVLFERYMAAARKISRLAVGERKAEAVFEKYEVPKFLLQDDRMSDDLPFGSRGGLAIPYNFPLDGDYTVRIFLQRNSRDYIRGLAEQHQLDVRLDGERIKLLTVGGGDELKGKPGPPFSQANTIGDAVSETYEHGGAEEHLEVRFSAKAGSRTIGVTFLNKDSVTEGVFRAPMTQFEMVQYKGGNPYIDNVVVSGPFNPTGLSDTSSRQKIFVCRPSAAADEEACAGKILSRLARFAYRRPVTDRDVRALLRVYTTDRDADGFESGIQAAIERILVGPEFLFRIEQDPVAADPDTVYRVNDIELASRLSFFLWSSIPDDELLKVAENGKLKDPIIFEQQVRRMLRDRRSRALIANFASQWLYLRNIAAKTPDPVLFPEFDENLRQAFQEETELFIESTLREDESVLRLLDSDYTFLNERLAKHYGVPNIYGSQFRRVTLPPEFAARRGLLGQGSLLTVTSYANRTSVVLRGKWLLENVLGAPPPPPPPNVPSLDDNDPEHQALPLRQLMEKHRSNPGCASCHAPMDPLGFALENFDAIGRWRTADGKTPVDASAVLPDGTRFNGPSGLRSVLLTRSEDFVHVVADRMLTYALGRGLEYYDAPTVRRIVREAAQENFRWSSLILATAKSMPFQMRRLQKP
jgi:hypothetical protein